MVGVNVGLPKSGNPTYATVEAEKRQAELDGRHSQAELGNEIIYDAIRRTHPRLRLFQN